MLPINDFCCCVRITPAAHSFGSSSISKSSASLKSRYSSSEDESCAMCTAEGSSHLVGCYPLRL